MASFALLVFNPALMKPAAYASHVFRALGCVAMPCRGGSRRHGARSGRSIRLMAKGGGEFGES